MALPEYQTISKSMVFEETEKRSKFISYAFSVDSEDEVRQNLKDIKAKHWEARHWVYAYRLAENNIEKYSDDGEPSGTAGLPVMNAIKSFGLQNILIIVVRYFGGVLLGSSGLRKMYGSGAAGVLKKSEIKTCVLCKHIIIHTEYKEYDKVSYILSKIGALVENAEYQDKIKLDVFVKKEDLDLILQNCLNYKLLEDRYKCI